MPKQMKKQWHGDRAVLFVHGVGNAKPGDYDDLVRTVRDSLSNRSDEVAFYELYYDVLNDWAAAKLDLGHLLTKVKSLFRSKVQDVGEDVSDDLATQIAETAGDVLLPAFSQSARLAVRDAYVLQLLQMVEDGSAAGVQALDQKLSIICHSLGCFHTFETLHAVVRHKNYGLHPTVNTTKLENVIFIASPVQLIRTAFGAVAAAVPGNDQLAVLENPALRQPCDPEDFAGSVRNWVSITGDLDPIGGHFLRKKASWAYMDIQPQESIIDDQTLTDNDEDNEVHTERLLNVLGALKAGLSTGSDPTSIPLQNPHSWAGYIKRHTEKIATWLLA